jgi:hypothetical protein
MSCLEAASSLLPRCSNASASELLRLAVRSLVVHFVLLFFLRLLRKPLRSRSALRAQKVKLTARKELKIVRGMLRPISRSRPQARVATKCRLHIEQKPKIKLARIVHTSTPEKYLDVLA